MQKRRIGIRKLVFFWMLEVGIWTFAFLALAQPQFPNSTPPQDPLMTLMMSQPRIDTTSPVRVSASFDPPTVRPGEKSIYRVTFSALEESIDWPLKISGSEGLQMSPGAHGQILQMTGPALVPVTSFNTRVRATATGQFAIPEFVVQVYGKAVTVPAALLQVVPAEPNLGEPPVRLLLQTSQTNLYLGQAFSARVILPAGTAGPVQGLAQVQLNGPDLVVDQGAGSVRVERMRVGGADVQAYIYQTMLTPMRTGKLLVYAQGFTAGMHFAGPITGPVALPPGPPQYTLLETEPIQLNVQPLPREGQLPGFTGAIGNFGLGAVTLESNNLRVGDPIRIMVTITNRGETNLARLVPPPAPRVKEWQIISAGSDGAPPQLVLARGFASFSYTLIPLSEKTEATPAIPFSCFDPAKGMYVDLTIGSLPVTVKPGAGPADAALLVKDFETKEQEPEPVLSGLAASPGKSTARLMPLQQQAWFPLVQLAPAAVFFGLWRWDRRRRFLERHPEIVLRKRARRALRREKRALRKAVRTHDSKGFAAAAVNAMRVACAPHYPAEPRALVGSDILECLQDANGSERNREVVRRFFGVSDAAQFGGGRMEGRDLLELEPELNSFLEEMEAKL